jgi:hypothetical protein
VDQPQPILVRGQCACGKRYRIRNAQAGITVMCPICRRPIPITDADMRAAEADTRLIPVQTESSEPLEVIPVDYGELTLAGEGSRPGLTGRQALDHEEAMLFNAQRGGLLAEREFAEAPGRRSRRGPSVFVELEPSQRGFVGDLLSSLYFAGSAYTALNALAIAIVCMLIGILYHSLPRTLLWFVVPVWGLLVLFVVQFFWSVLRRTAFGEDRVPLAAPDSSFWHDAVKPLFWLLGVSLLCCMPAWLLGRFASLVTPVYPFVLVLALGAGWFFWPVAVMSVGLGNSIVLLRPDWLVRCVIAIGPAYIIAWVAVLVAAAGWFVFDVVSGPRVWPGVLGFGVEAYLGYGLFRTLGLLYRHFHVRFPWWF